MVEPSDRLRGWSNHTIINGGGQTGLGRGIATWPCGQQAEEGNPKPKWSPGELHCLKNPVEVWAAPEEGGGSGSCQSGVGGWRWVVVLYRLLSFSSGGRGRGSS